LTPTNTGWICSALDSSPTVSTVEQIAVKLLSEYDSQQAADVLVSEVVADCPEHISVLKQFVKKWG